MSIEASKALSKQFNGTYVACFWRRTPAKSMKSIETPRVEHIGPGVPGRRAALVGWGLKAYGHRA